jgi:DNA excision repair protein ERCC-2
VIGVGLPGLSIERDLLVAYFDQKERPGFDYAYRYPGMQRVLQAVGRTDTIRRRSRGGPVGRSPLPRTQIRNLLPKLVEGHPG